MSVSDHVPARKKARTVPAFETAQAGLAIPFDAPQSVQALMLMIRLLLAGVF
jgi:hypothetical protein